jgi:flagellum-specific ATP synthase
MVRVGKNLLGRVIDGWGRFIDGGPTVYREDRQPLTGSELSPLNRPRIDRTLSTGVRVIDALLSTGMGQRMGIFAGSGVGKSTLMGMMARQSEADINVVVLVGERGREVREFLERDLARKVSSEVSSLLQPANNLPCFVCAPLTWVLRWRSTIVTRARTSC